MSAKKQPTYEENVRQLEQIVQSLERGDLPLDEALKLFETGTKLIRASTKLLDTAEQKVVTLIQNDDGSFGVEV